MKVALVYDRVNKWGGAERILLSLHKIFPTAPLFTSVYSEKNAPWANIFTIHTSFLQNIPFAKQHHEFFAPLMPIAFEQFDFTGYDVVISVTSEAAKGIIVSKKTKHICICLTPTRYLWSGYTQYFKNKAQQIIAWPMVAVLREWDMQAAKRPDVLIAISKEVQKRIKKYYKRDSEIIYPPMTLVSHPERSRILSKQDRDPSITPSGSSGFAQDDSRKGYFLVVSRLSKFTSYKRVDLAIKAANRLKVQLVIVGDGDSSHFKKIAGPTVRFVGKISDKKLAGYYAMCKALIFPGIEDFGLVMAEAQSFGKPVIAFKAGGALEIVQMGKTGTFFEKQTVESLTRTLKTFNEKAYNSKDCKTSASRFSLEQFEKKIRALVK